MNELLRSKFLFLLYIVHITSSLEDVKILNDATVLVGKNTTLYCKGMGLQSPIRDCSWKSPSSIKYSFKDIENHLRGVRVTLQERGSSCFVDIDLVTFEMSGAWECILEDSERALGKFAFLRVFDPIKDDFQVISNFDEKEKSVIEGGDVSLTCRANHIVQHIGDRTTCIWNDPNGRRFDVIGNHGEIYEYWPDGIISIGDPDEGECGIMLKNTKLHQSGIWKCQLIRKSPHGIGSQVANSKIDVKVIQNLRYIIEPTLQGYEKGEINAVISLAINEPKYTDALSFFWIIQRKYLIYEGDQWFCPSKLGVCYEPRRRKYLRSPTGTKIILDLVISEVTTPDLEEPIVLIMEYVEKNSSSNVYNYMSRIFKVPKRRHKRHPRIRTNQTMLIFQ
ncbi:uncharacterized protein [Lepeophtheirus salmonis]|nr:uncharacterized protein LOC121131922 [Lepeophtheirus salmonis]